MVRFLVGTAALLVAACAHFAAFSFSFLGTCAISDTANRQPAPASVQGQVCQAVSDGERWTYVAGALLAVSVILAVVLAVRWWAVPRWRVLGLAACLWLPVLMFVGFRVPGDSCTDEQRRELPAYSCDRTTDS